MKELDENTCRSGSGLINQLQLLWRYAMVIATVFLCSTGAFAQSAPVLPDADRCVAQDLLATEARLVGDSPCYTCEEGNQILSTLQLTIYNKTGSVRTSVAYWATLEVTDPEGNATESYISGCTGPLSGSEYENFGFGEITYNCGDALKLKNIYLAWTDASTGDRNQCPLESSSIAPKCRAQGDLVIIPPLSARVESSVKPCVGENNGSINVFAQGGSGEGYIYTLNSGEVTNSTGVFENLGTGNYTITVTDDKQCSTQITFTLGDQVCCVLPTVSTHPGNDSVCEGEGASFTLAYTGGDPAPVIQWQMSTDDGATWVNITDTGVYSGATTTSLSISATAEAMNGNWYRASLKSGTCDAVYTDPAELDVNEIPGAPRSGGNQEVCATDPIQTLTATATAPAGSTVVWYSAETGGSVVANPTLSEVGSIIFYAESLSEAGCRSTTRTAVTLTINAVPNAPVLSVTDPDCTSAMGRLTITSPTTDLMFSVNGAAYVAYPEAGWPLAAGDYTVTARNADECVSAEATITIKPQPASPAAPVVTVSQPTCAQAGSITVTSPEGEGYTYSLDGETWQVETLFANLGPGDYTIWVKNAAGCITAGDEVTINPVPDAPATPVVMVTQPNCNSPMGIIVVTSPTAGLMFSFNGGEYAAYPTGGYTLAAGGAYTLVARNAALCVSGAATGTIDAQPVTPAAPTLVATQPTCEVSTGGITITSSTTGLVFYVYNVNNLDNDIIYEAYPTGGWTGLAPGTYNVIARIRAGCISAVATVVINNQPVTPNANAGVDKVLTCTTTSVMLNGSSTTAGATYAWVASDGGNIVSGANTATPTVNAAGTYTLTVTNSTGGCTATDVVVVTGDATLPNVDILIYAAPPATITCNNPSITIVGSSSTANVDIKWTGPNGFTSDQNSITVTVPGTYTFTVTNPLNGCTASKSTEILNGIRYSTISAGPDKVLTCQTPAVTLEGSIDNPYLYSWGWIAPDGSALPRDLNPVVTEPGTYTLRVSTREGCVSEDIVVVTRDGSTPNVSAKGGTLSCANGSLQLMGYSTTAGISYSWTGPDGYTSSMQHPTVTVAGNYTLTVTNRSNGCTASATVTVNPQPRGSDPIVTCHTMNFGYDHYRKGLITTINTPEGPVAVTARKRNPDGTYAAQNHAALFDTQAPTGDDTDLYTRDWGLALIINQDQTNVPNDNQWGGEMLLDFSAIGPVTMESLRALDIDGYEGMSWIYLYDGQGNELYKVRLQSLGDNSRQTVNLGNTKGVMMMKVVMDGRNESGHLAGSGAIDDIRFCVEEPGTPCVDDEQETTDAVSISSVSAYPTPFFERATIEFRVHNTENYVVNLYDTKGMLIKQLKAGTAVAGEMNTVEVDGRNLAEGLYLARIASESGAKTVKLILKR